MHTTKLTTLLALATLTVSAHAQTAPATTAPAPAPVATPAAPTLSDTDKKYLTDSAQGSLYDQATAELAVMQAQSPAVQQYATRLVYDHDRLNMQLLQLARRYNLVLPLTMQTSDTTKLTTMQGQSGAAFDRAYLQDAVQINSDDIKTATTELNGAKDPEIYAFVLQFRDTEAMHLQMAQDLLATLK